jgi:hypothetical protein
LVLLASLFEPPVDEVRVPNISPGLTEQPSILNLTRTLSLHELPALAVMKSPLTTSTRLKDADFVRQMTQNSEWRGKSVSFEPR